MCSTFLISLTQNTLLYNLANSYSPLFQGHNVQGRHPEEPEGPDQAHVPQQGRPAPGSVDRPRSPGAEVHGEG